MRSLKLIAIAGAFLFLSLMSKESFAARMESYSVIYFDQYDNVVGQHAEFCNNVQWEGGQQNGHYALEVVGGCGDQIYSCHPTENWSHIICTDGGSYYAIGAQLFGNTAGRSLEYACSTTDCSSNEPTLVNNWGFTMVCIWGCSGLGIQPSGLSYGDRYKAK